MCDYVAFVCTLQVTPTHLYMINSYKTHIYIILLYIIVFLEFFSLILYYFYILEGNYRKVIKYKYEDDVLNVIKPNLIF